MSNQRKPNLISKVFYFNDKVLKDLYGIHELLKRVSNADNVTKTYSIVFQFTRNYLEESLKSPFEQDWTNDFKSILDPLEVKDYLDKSSYKKCIFNFNRGTLDNIEWGVNYLGSYYPLLTREDKNILFLASGVKLLEDFIGTENFYSDSSNFDLGDKSRNPFGDYDFELN